MNEQNEIQVSEDLTMKVISDDGMYNKVFQMAEMMSKSNAIPQHLKQDHGACFNIVIQAMQWKMNPFAVAQKTHSIKGNIGYEAQLINAVINAHAPIEAPIDYELFGPWENILGKFQVATNSDGKQYNKSILDKDAEKGCGVRAWATLKGEEKPREVELFMAQCPVRNSTNWANDPQQQLIYMAQKKWARRFCPEIILGVYSPDEMPEEQPKKATALEIIEQSDNISDAQNEAINIDAEVVNEESISVKQIVYAIGLPKDKIIEYFKTLDGKWGINESLSEIGQGERKVIIADPIRVKSAIEKLNK